MDDHKIVQEEIERLKTKQKNIKGPGSVKKKAEIHNQIAELMTKLPQNLQNVSSGKGRKAGETDSDYIARLESEKDVLEELNITLNEAQPSLTNDEADYFKDIDYIDKVGRVDTNVIKVKDIHDHKNISLWTPLGKRVGPLHPSNAKATYMRFRKLGKRLLVQEPSLQQIDAYKLTDEYKVYKKNFDENRARKNKSRGKGQIEKLAASIAVMSGVPREQVNSVMAKENVRVGTAV